MMSVKERDRLFSERKQMVEEYHKWRRSYNLPDTAFNVICWVTQKYTIEVKEE